MSPGTPMRAFFSTLILLFTLLLSARAHSSEDILLAEVASKNIDPTRYLVSEKLDGVRAIWDGTTLRFRSGHIVPAPRWFTDALPKTPLDGELWLGRNKFDELSGLVRKLTPIDSEWRALRYQIFELPNAPGTFLQRYQHMAEIIRAANFVQLHRVEQREVMTDAALSAWLAEVVAAGGEGLMLHLKASLYHTGRSRDLLKLKPVLDAEATVLRQLPGKGKFVGLMGSLEVQTDQGVVFRLGTGFKDVERANAPAVGTRVTFTYRGLSKNGKPRFASFLRVRIDP
jgi:DNA ligase 1